MKQENEIFMRELEAKHGPFYAHAVQMVSISYATICVLNGRRDENEDEPQLNQAFQMLANEAYVQYSAICRRMGDEPVGGVQTAEDAKRLAHIAWKMQEQFDALDNLQPTTRAN